MQLVGRAVEDRSAERVVAGEGVGVLAPAAAAEREPAGAARPAGTAATARAAAGAARVHPPRRPAGAAAAADHRPALTAGAEALRELAGGRIELAAADRLEPIAHHAAIDAGHAAVDRDRLGRTLGREAGRQEQRRRFALALGRIHFEAGRRARSASGPPASRSADRVLPPRPGPEPRRARPRWRHAARPAAECSLRRLTAAAHRAAVPRPAPAARARAGTSTVCAHAGVADRDVPLDLAKAGQLGGQVIRSGRQVDVIRAVGIRRGRTLDGAVGSGRVTVTPGSGVAALVARPLIRHAPATAPCCASTGPIGPRASAAAPSAAASAFFMTQTSWLGQPPFWPTTQFTLPGVACFTQFAGTRPMPSSCHMSATGGPWPRQARGISAAVWRLCARAHAALDARIACLAEQGRSAGL